MKVLVVLCPVLVLGIFLLFSSGCHGGRGGPMSYDSLKPAEQKQWRGVHFLSPGKKGMPSLLRAIDEVLAPMGVNVLIFEVNYGFDYQSHPELRTGGYLTRNDVKELVALCRKHDIGLIPQFNCLGHQSWAKNTFPLLKEYPQFDETPEIPLDNPDIYCRSWCPLHPEVNKVIFDLFEELIDAFEADAFHVGMDEVFLIAHEQCSRCRGKNPARLFARAVNDYHRFLVEKKGLTMLMWGDRLLDAKEMKYSEWEASANGTAPAIDMIPRDIIICDWHYGKQEEYLSVPYFQEKGFRVWPSSWKEKDASLALLTYSREHSTERMIGHLCTTWYGAGELARQLLGEKVKSKNAAEARKVIKSLRACMEDM